MRPALVIERRGGRPRRRSGVVGPLVTVLALAAAAATGYVAWPHVSRSLSASRTPVQPRTRVVTVAARSTPEPVPAPVPEVRESARAERVSDVPPRARRDAATERKPTPRREMAAQPGSEPAPDLQPSPEESPPEPAPAADASADPSPEPPPVDVEKVHAAVGAAITRGYEALRRKDFGGARRAFDEVAGEALADQQATDRLQPWRQLAVYAEQYPEYRDRALASAASTTATYDLGGFQIGVVEFTPREFIYRDSRRPGRNLRVPRDAIPPEVEHGLVEQWFAKDGRASNNLFLGVAALARRDPDRAAARRAWQAAAAGGEPQGTLLLQILDDPVVRR